MGKLDQSLDEILSTQRRTARRPGRGRHAATAAKASVVRAAAPVGGVKKSTRNAKTNSRGSIPTGPAAGTGDSKIIVSNLPTDVNEGQIKEYFTKSVGPVKKVLVTYGPNGVSRGVATIIFNKADAANKALKECNGLLVDGRGIKVEVVLDATRAPAPVPARTLSERVAQPKAQPKPATAKKATTNGTAGKATRGRGVRGARSARGARSQPKSVEQLDAEMDDYMDTGTGVVGVDGGNVVNGANEPVAVNGGVDTGMDDEISVGLPHNLI
ncbi:MAG: hypothetical protein M1837_000394 [Sclerophora amabilis]|nr:MAG: hypothetical protein M1837_000394 [Sclerophora amabilis]